MTVFSALQSFFDFALSSFISFNHPPQNRIAGEKCLAQGLSISIANELTCQASLKSSLECARHDDRKRIIEPYQMSSMSPDMIADLGVVA